MRVLTFIFCLSFLLPHLLEASVSDTGKFSCYIKDPYGRSREHNIDLQHMKLIVSFNATEGQVVGDVRYVFSPIRKSIDTIKLDAIEMDIRSVEIDNVPVKFHNTDTHLYIYLNKPLAWETEHRLRIQYSAAPEKGIYFVGWNDPLGKSQKQIWTQGQGIDNRHWIPSYDFQNDKLITETIITFDREYTVISNGDLIEEVLINDDEKQWHYKMDQPHVSYLIMIAIGKYDHETMKAGNGVEIRQYYYDGMEEKIEPTYKYSEEMMDWMEEEFGVPYPWSTYANVPVQDFIYGAMENTTATIYTDYYLQDENEALERSYIGTNAHELVHQWFGDYITAWSSHDHWLHESFATYYSKTFRKHVLGKDEFQWIRHHETRAAISAGKKNNLPVVHSRAGSARHYQKGSLVIDMMKDIVGKVQFQKVIKHFLKSHPYGLVDTHDLFQAFLEVLGMNLDWFFEQWLYKGGEPHYRITQDIQKTNTIIYVEQIQDITESVSYFKMPIKFDVYYEGNSIDSTTQWVKGPVDTVIIPNPSAKKVAFVLFDPNNKVLKNVDYENKDKHDWINQLLMAQNMIDRYTALTYLEDEDFKSKRKELLLAYDNERYYAMKAGIVRQLAENDHKSSQELMQKALYDPNVYVRRSVIENTEEINENDLKDYETLLKDPSYINIVKALKKLSKIFPERRIQYLEETKDITGQQNIVRIAWLKLAMQDDRKHLDKLIELTAPSYDFRTRINAIEAISDIEECNVYILNNLSNAMTHFNRRLRQEARSALKKMCGLDEQRLEVESFYEEREWDKEEIEIWKKVFE